ncbi:hypothetical protein [Hymenobacter fodinae]|uniref:DUF541 domain-containing protein n=1 Tax=Hymenobacter fodinae TaxID=2510796 RepID=A0A4Z0P210_9BACT|nr:hypothetical protein [Hymenobacter fodinae]TGE04777.1 hypothetical protein EU556_21590 [Hymenobacter fodinae]
MKRLFYLMGCLLILSSSPMMAQGDQPNVVVVRAIESNLNLIIITARGGATHAREELKFAGKNYSEQVTAKYQQLIDSYLQQGFVLQSMTSQAYANSTFVFVKAPKP